jgi:hypothetical protein
MATLRGRNPKATVQELLKINASGLTSTLASIESGEGISTPFQLSTTQIALNGITWPTTGAASGKVLTVSSNGTSAEWATVEAGGSSDWDDLTNKPAVIAAGATDVIARKAINVPVTEYFSVVYSGLGSNVMLSVVIGDQIPGAPTGMVWAAGQYLFASTNHGGVRGSIWVVNTDGTKSQVIGGLVAQSGDVDFDRIITSVINYGSTNFIYRVRNGVFVSVTQTATPNTGALYHQGASLFTALGDLSTLTTTAKTELVAAINEVNTAKAPLASPTFTGTVSGITKSMVGLSNVDNTTDAAKPISSATQTALNAKVSTGAVPYDIAAPVFGKPAASEIVLRVRTQRAFTLDTFYGYAATAATTASAVFTVTKNGSSIGTITFSTSTNASTTTVATTSFAIGDVLTITAPASQNATLADIDFFLKGTA